MATNEHSIPKAHHQGDDADVTGKRTDQKNTLLARLHNVVTGDVKPAQVQALDE